MKAVGDGTSLIHSLRPGVLVLVLAEGPHGAMTERRRTRQGVLLIAGGVGITPMGSLFETLPSSVMPLSLLCRASRETDVISRSELEAIAIARGRREHPSHRAILRPE